MESPEDIFRSGILDALKRVKAPEEWVCPPAKQDRSGKMRPSILKPSLGGLAIEPCRSRVDHESVVASLITFHAQTTASRNDVISFDDVSRKDLNAVLCVMRLSASTSQKKFFKKG